jgi:nucleobase:cation symporter-1, NCS1 family
MSADPMLTESGTFSIEQNGLDVITEAERKGKPSDLFWPWCAANISVFGLSYAAFVLYFGLNIWQALLASVVGTVLSFVLVGLVSLAGKRGSAPTMVLSRASFGVRGNALPSLVGYLILVGWEIVLVSLAVLATATIFKDIGWSSGDFTKVVAFLVVVAIIVLAGIIGFDLIMRLQRVITIATVVITVGYILLTVDELSWDTIDGMASGSTKALIGALLLMMTAFGLSWTNSAADYSRYLPRSASSAGVLWWTIFGSAVAPVILLVYGLLLVGSRPGLINKISADPIGTLANLLPTWYLVPFAVVAVLGLIAGAVLDIYSSGLTLLALGLPVKRWMAAGLDGVLMIIGSIYVVWFAQDFIGPFEGFLITLGVPITAWCGVFLADLALRKRDYDDAALFDLKGRYGSENWVSIGLMLVATVLGWGLVVNTLSHAFSWEGYLLGPFGLGGKSGTWGGANLGVAVAFVVCFVGYYLLCAQRVSHQETFRVAEGEPGRV